MISRKLYKYADWPEHGNELKSMANDCLYNRSLTKIKVLNHWKLYKDAYILQESFATTDKSYPPSCRIYLQPFYLSVTLYACAQRDKMNQQAKSSEPWLIATRDG